MSKETNSEEPKDQELELLLDKLIDSKSCSFNLEHISEMNRRLVSGSLKKE